MKDNSIELIQLISDLKNSLDMKVKMLSDENPLNYNSQTEINNITRKIEALDEYVKEINGLYSSRNDIVINFRKRTIDIMSEIELL